LTLASSPDDHVDARFANGVLTMRFSKIERPSSTVRKIDIQ